MFKQLYIRFKILINRLARQRNHYINDKNFLIIAALWVGILSGIAAVVLKTIVHKLQHLLEGGFNVQYENYLYLIYPLIGILLSVLYLRLFHKKTIFDKGLSSIIYAISRKGSTVERHKTYTHIITSALTVGFGGSVGLEAPIAVTGSAIGANTAKDLLMNRQDRTLLLASGAAAGIAAIFNSPIAGVIFAFEVLLSEASVPAFIPLLIASASGAVVSKLFYSGQLFFLTTNDWSFSALPYYILLGGFCGIVSTYVIRTVLATEHYFHERKNPWQKALWGGLILGVMLFFLPPLYGEGYSSVNQLMTGNYKFLLDKSLFYDYNNNAWFILIFVATMILLKVFAAAITMGAGGNGGIFGPSIFIGALCGFLFSRFMNVTHIAELNEQNFIAVAMGGLISGALHAPLTGIFLIAEITGGYMLFVPLMIVSAMSYFVTRYFEPNSLYKKNLIERGFIAPDKDSALLSNMSIHSIVEQNFTPILPGQTMGELVEVIAHSNRNVFPVVDHESRLVGVVALDEIREVMFQHDLYNQKLVKDLMTIPPVTVDVNEQMDDVMGYFEEFNLWNIPVTKEGKYFGFISKSGVFNQYREKLKND